MDSDTFLASDQSKKQPIPLIYVGIGLLVIGCIGFLLALTPPRLFPVGEIIAVTEGFSARTIARTLSEKKVIRSESLFMVFSELVGGSNGIRAGDYVFDQNLSVYQIAYRMSRGMYGSAQIKITVPEGSSVLQIATNIKKQIPEFDLNTFLEKAMPLEGYLFPSTYFISQAATPDMVIDLMRKEFEKQYAKLYTTNSSHAQKDVVVMASLLEKEAFNRDQAEIVSGILWKRIGLGMPLQVDAPFLYRLGKTSEQLTLADLKSDDPYNLYIHTGLSPAPIGNPGIDMLFAALNPKDSPYLYYLHDIKGNVYYAKTFEEHLKNRRLYID